MGTGAVRISARLAVGLALLAGVWWCAPARGEVDQVGLPRLIRLFDFEERIGQLKLGDLSPLPMRWYVIGRPAGSSDTAFQKVPIHDQLVLQPGYPLFTEVRYDRAVRRDGDFSLLMRIDGGNAGAFLESGAVKAMPGSDYMVSTMVRTEGLEHSRAVLVAYFIDKDGHRIDGSVATSTPVLSEGRWTAAAVKLNGDYPAAASIGIQIELQQPRRQADSPLGKYQIVHHDVRGKAWFDDVAVWQVPRALVTTQSSANVVRAPDRPMLSTTVRDLTGLHLVADMTVFDHRGRKIDAYHHDIGRAAPTQFAWRPELPAHGWYVVELVLSDIRGRTATDGSERVSRTFGTFLWLPRESEMMPEESERFVLDAQGIPEHEVDRLPAILEATGLRSAILSCWERGTTRARLEDRQARLGAVLAAMGAKGQTAALSLNPLPDELAEKVGVGSADVLEALRRSPSDWLPYLGPILMRQGQRVAQWHMGTPDHPQAFYMAELAQVISGADVEFRNLAPSPQLVVPWSLSQSRRVEGEVMPGYFMDTPVSVRPPSIAAHLDGWREGRQPRVVLRLASMRADELSHPRRVADLALRMVQAWEASVDGLAISRPWTHGDTRLQTLAPDPLLGVFSSVSHRLRGRRALGRLHVAEGIECVIFDGNDGGMLALWSEGGSPETAVTADLYLGANPVEVDVWGNRSPMALVNGKHHVTATAAPVFIEGADARLALMRAHFRADPSFIQSTQAPTTFKVTLANPWPRMVSGTIQVMEPANWQIEPQQTSFTIPAGGMTTVSLKAAVPVSETSGRKYLVARADFFADRRYRVDLRAPLDLGLKNVRFDAAMSLERDAKAGRIDAVVTLTVANTGAEAQTLYAFASLPGYPRQERLIPRLEPGQSAVRTFRFADAVEVLRRSNVRVGLREASGPAMINKILSMEASR